MGRTSGRGCVYLGCGPPSPSSSRGPRSGRTHTCGGGCCPCTTAPPSTLPAKAPPRFGPPHRWTPDWTPRPPGRDRPPEPRRSLTVLLTSIRSRVPCQRQPFPSHPGRLETRLEVRGGGEEDFLDLPGQKQGVKEPLARWYLPPVKLASPGQLAPHLVLAWLVP